MNWKILFCFVASINLIPLLSTTKGSITQTIQDVDDNMYIYTFQDIAENTYKIYRFTTEQIVTCFTNQVTDGTTNHVYINVILLSLSVQFDYRDTNTEEIAACDLFANTGSFNLWNYNDRKFHNNMLNYDGFFRNFHKNMLQSYNDSYTFNDSKLQQDHALIADEKFLDQTQTLDETLDLDQYHILSSHNTYLEDNEYYGQSVSERAIIRQLYLGFRSFELDLWAENQPSGSDFPIYVSIQHQFTFLHTNNIDLKSTLNIIGQYGFMLDDSPIIMNFENHIFTVNDYQYFINALEESGLTYLMASDLNDPNIYQFQNLKNTVVINMNFSENDKNLNVQAASQSIQNDALNSLYKNQYVEDPLSQFLSGGSYLTYMTDQIFSPSQSEFDQITQSNIQTQSSINKKSTSRKTTLQTSTQETPTIQLRGATTISGDYYTTNKALEYSVINHVCYPEVNNIVLFAFQETSDFQDLKTQIQSIDNDFACKSMTRVYTGFWRGLSGNYNPLVGWVLGVNIIALNGQNIDSDVHDYLNLFTTRNGYREIDNITVSPKKQYQLQIREIYIPKKASFYTMNVKLFTRDTEYQENQSVTSKLLYVYGGRNTRSVKDTTFQARDQDFLYISAGYQYRYSVMIKDIFVSGTNEVNNNIYQIAILRSLKNYYWDGAFVKLRIVGSN